MSTAILTIDDIASKNTPAIVDYLKEKKITAVMFAVGENVEKYYDEAIYALQAGMIVGNHSYSHPAFSSISLEQGIAEIEKNEEVLNKLYKDAGVGREYKLFRFPYGDRGAEKALALQDYFASHGFEKLNDTKIPYPYWRQYNHARFIDTFWSFDFEEYRIRPGSDFALEDVWRKMNNFNPAQGGTLFRAEDHNIILMHAHDETEEMVPRYYAQFIDYCLENGVTFVEPNVLSK